MKLYSVVTERAKESNALKAVGLFGLSRIMDAVRREINFFYADSTEKDSLLKSIETLHRKIDHFERLEKKKSA